MAYPTVMTPALEAHAWELQRANVSRKAAAGLLGVSEKAAGNWAKRNGVLFADGRSGTAANEARARRLAQMVEASAALRRLPLDADERRRYLLFRDKARKMGVPVTRDDAFRAIGRPDLASQNTPGASSASVGARPSRAAPYRAPHNNTPSAGAGTK